MEIFSKKEKLNVKLFMEESLNTVSCLVKPDKRRSYTVTSTPKQLY